MNEAKIKEVFSDKAYVESIVKMSAEDAAKSLQEKGVEVSAEDLMKVHDYVVTHKDELANGELSEEALASVAGGVEGLLAPTLLGIGALFSFVGTLAVMFSW